MALYRFRYLDESGTTHTGEAEAEERDDLVRELQAKGTVLEVVASSGNKRLDTKPTKSKQLFSLGLSKEDLSLYTRQMGTMLMAGLPILKVIAIMRKRCKNRRFAEILDDVAQGVQGGTRFSDCLAKHPDVFDGLYVNLVKVGEASGKLAPIVDGLANLLDKQVALQRKVGAAMSYPAFILIFTVLLSWVIVAFLMPLFAPMFTSAGLNLQVDYPLTYVLLAVTNFVNDRTHMVLGVIAVVVLVAVVRTLLRTPTGQLLKDRVLFSLPLLGTMFRYAAVARFARTLSTLMSSGLPLMQSLTLVGGAAGNAVVTASLSRVANHISKGKRISDAIETENKVFPDLLIQMTQVGEEAGALPQMLERAADYYEMQLDSAVQRLVAMLEPAMMVMVGCIVCAFVMAVLLPILGLAQIK